MVSTSGAKLALFLILAACTPFLALSQNTYTVESGDTFSSIASNYGTTAEALQSANPGIPPTNLQIGQVINLPGSSPGSSDSSTSDVASSASDVTITAAEFAQALTSNGFSAVADSKRTNMLASIQKLGGSLVISSRRELAMFLAQLLQESGGLQLTKETNGEDQPYAPYYGRGYIQLTGEENYQSAADALGNPEIVNDPDSVAESDSLSWDVTTWYWKAFVHSAPGVQDGKFGAATNAINGPLECSSGPTAQANQRCTYYKAVLPILDSTATADCSGCGSSRKLLL